MLNVNAFSNPYVLIPAKIFIGFALGYLIATLVESFIHQHVFHSKQKRLKKSINCPRIFNYLIDTRYSHHIVHHCKTFQQDYVTQFPNLQESQKLDKELATRGRHGQIIKESGYGIKLQGSGALVFITPFLPGIPLTITLLGIPGLCGAIVAMALPALLTNFAHTYLHMPHEKAVTSAHFPISLLLQTRYFRAIARNHFLHHRYVMCNFNLLLGGDILRCVSRKPSETDLIEMRRIGLRLD